MVVHSENKKFQKLPVPTIFRLKSSNYFLVSSRRFFTLSFSSRSIPKLWKRSCIVPVPKKPVISCRNDPRPVALTSIPMNIYERLVMKLLTDFVSTFMDPMQFAYRSHRSCSDTILVVLEKLYSHRTNKKRLFC